MREMIIAHFQKSVPISIFIPKRFHPPSITRHLFSQVFIPAEGMDEFQQNLGELINEYDTGDAEDALAAPQNRHLRVENKNFYFDIKRNAQGRYMTISEVKGNFRNSILIPEIGWENFRDVLDDYVKQVKEGD